jgi:hypothetical protein
MHGYKLDFAVALGGFLILIGIVMVGVFTLMLSGSVDFTPLESHPYRVLSLSVLLVVGVLDLLAGVILRRK